MRYSNGCPLLLQTADSPFLISASRAAVRLLPGVTCQTPLCLATNSRRAEGSRISTKLQLEDLDRTDEKSPLNDSMSAVCLEAAKHLHVTDQVIMNE